MLKSPKLEKAKHNGGQPDVMNEDSKWVQGVIDIPKWGGRKYIHGVS
ncbi:hypothetical protein NNC19_18610 [Clostridium sp. SHJSY1]|nr:hypothetical protein [Clostridium sp. SHJSY1]MDS0527705.1 hypothetical protein [Clostridium sp. SHJSY1]